MSPEQKMLEKPKRFTAQVRDKSAPAFAIGDRVRISRVNRLFSKGYHENFSREIFQIYNVSRRNNVDLFYLKDSLGEKILNGFYRQELVLILGSSKTDIEKVIRTVGKGKNKKYFVKWVGYDERHNSYIKARDVSSI